MAAGESVVALHLFRKGLRLHDNPALMEGISRRARRIYPVYVLEPGLDKRDIGINRYTHMLESLEDLDGGLRRLGSRLFVLQGDTMDQLRQAVLRWKVNLLTFEEDSEPTSIDLESRISALAKVDKPLYSARIDVLQELNVEIASKCGHTLFSPTAYDAASKRKKISYGSYGSFCKLFLAMGPVRSPLPAPSKADMPQVTYAT